MKKLLEVAVKPFVGRNRQLNYFFNHSVKKNLLVRKWALVLQN